MSLDFRKNGRPHPELRKRIDRLGLEHRSAFNDAIDEVSRRFKFDMSWMFSLPAGRNILMSRLYYHCLALSAVKERLESGEPVESVHTDSKAFGDVLTAWLKEKGAGLQVECRESGGGFAKRLIKPLFYRFGFLAAPMVRHILARRTKFRRQKLPESPITLIDTFMMPGFAGKDRYYTGLFEALSQEEQKAVYYVPTFFGIRFRDMVGICRILRSSDRNYLLKEDYLKLSDYWWAWRWAYMGRKLTAGPVRFDGFDISPLINEELRSHFGMGSAMLAFINYTFAKRLKERGVRLRLVLDWFENQVVDKGWNSGFGRYYPETPTKGYMGFVPQPLYISFFPTQVESEAGFLPKEILVIGRALRDSMKTFCADVNVDSAPALRYRHVHDELEDRRDKARFTVLAALPLDVSAANAMVRMLADAEPGLPKDVRFLIKAHPVMRPGLLHPAVWESNPERFEMIADDFKTAMERCDLLISSASSTCMEALASGLPVIVIGGVTGLTVNPIPEGVSDALWRLCYDRAELVEAVAGFFSGRLRDSDEGRPEFKRLREDYFIPVTGESVRRMLLIDPVKQSGPAG